MIIDRSYENLTVAVSSQDTFTVVLDEVPTSGYRWQVALPGENWIILVKDEYRKGESAGIGGGGKHYFTFVANKTGQTTLTFINRQQWEGGEEGDRFSVQIKVQ